MSQSLQTLQNKVVLITGAARGIGRQTAILAAERGARVAALGMEPEKLRALVDELGPGHMFAECDVTNQAQLDAAVKAAVETLGGIDAVIANAGIASNGTVAISPVEAMIRVIDVNVSGVIRTVAATLPYVTERRGYILIVSSAAALRALPGMAPYAASKSGVEQFGNVLRLEVAHKGVTVGVAHPSWVDTDLVRDVQHDVSTFNEMLKKLPGPLGNTVTVEECAEAFVQAIEKRQKKLFVPKSLAVLSAIRPLFAGPLVDQVVERDARATIPRFEEEVSALGRSFGSTSVGLGSDAESGAAGATGPTR